METLRRYRGTLVSHDATKHCGFIGLKSVSADDGSAHDLQTAKDIFVHQDDCGSALRGGMEISFEVRPDDVRKGDALRAYDVTEVVAGELVPVGAESFGTSRALADPRSLYVPPTPAQRRLMKPVAPEAVEKVLANKPMPTVPRMPSGNARSAVEINRQLMRRLFPQFEALSDGADIADERFDEVIKQAVDDHKSLGMMDQVARMLDQAKSYKDLRTLLRDEEDLLKPETLIPIQYLPDLFMAVPVWYFWADTATQKEAKAIKTHHDPQVHRHLQHMCSLVPTDRWADTFLMYNRRMRTLNEYKGDLIPPRIVSRMRKMADLFDYMVIMTPYHDVAGQDWQDVNWLRSIDPYVVGFLKKIPLMFIIGRFSDSGTFPLYSELVADTIAFLRANVEKLSGFNTAVSPYWYRGGGPKVHQDNTLGTYLIKHTRELLQAYDHGNLFDWLRGEDTLPART